MNKDIVQIRNISKQFPSILANDNISFTIKYKSIHALLGENGAGKSTLVKILYGILEPNSGEIIFNDNKFIVNSPSEARKLGIGMVFQHFSLFDSLTTGENLILGLNEKISFNKLKEKVESISSKYELPLDLKAPITTLSAGEKQRVEIVRILLQDPKLLIMDEPTSVLIPQEIDRLFITLNALVDDGRTILYITHKLEEVIKICNEVTIMRSGRVVETCLAKDESAKSLATKMLGKKLPEIQKNASAEISNSNIALKINNLNTKYNDPFLVDLVDINFDVKEGEIYGIAGIAGNGQSELMSVLSGEETIDDNSKIIFYDKNIANLGPKDRRNLSIAFVPEDRLGHSAIPHLSLVENVLLSQFKGNNFSKWGIIDFKNVEDQAKNIVNTFNVITPNVATYAGSLSGGNLQKFVIGREILSKPKMLIISHPTWGIDAGAELAIRQALINLTKQGTSIIIISQDLDELIEITDRLSVIYSGKLSKPISTKDISIEKLGLLMGGKFD